MRPSTGVTKLSAANALVHQTEDGEVKTTVDVEVSVTVTELGVKPMGAVHLMRSESFFAAFRPVERKVIGLVLPSQLQSKAPSASAATRLVQLDWSSVWTERRSPPWRQA